MNKDCFANTKKVGEVKPEIIQVQFEDYCVNNKIIILNCNILEIDETDTNLY